VVLDDVAQRTRLLVVPAAALQPALFRLLVLHPEASALDHQESDERVNTIWGFHRDFDLLTLLALAEHTDLLFLEATPTPSAAYSRAAAWFAESGASARPVRRMVAADGSLSASALSAAFPLSAPERGSGGEVPCATIRPTRLTLTLRRRCVNAKEIDMPHLGSIGSRVAPPVTRRSLLLAAATASPGRRDR